VEEDKMHLTVQKRILGMLLLFLIGTLAMETIHIWSERDALISEKKLTTQHLVKTAIGVISHYKAQEDAGLLNQAAAQQQAMEAVRGMRYGEGEYFFILDAVAPVMLMHPAQPALDGKRFDTPQFNRVTRIEPGNGGRIEITDGKTNLGEAFHRLAEQAGSGFVTYTWPKPSAGADNYASLYPKLSYVEKYAPWGWVVGSGIYIDTVETVVWHNAIRYIILVSLIGGILTMVALLLANSVIRPLQQSTEQLMAMSNAEDFGPLPVERDDEIGALIRGYNRLQAMLHERETSLRLAASVVENSLEGIVVANTEQRIINVNPAFCAMTGYRRQGIIGTGLDALAALGEDKAGCYAEKLQAGQNWEGNWTIRCSDGHSLVTHTAIVPVRGKHGTITHYVAVFQDVTEQLRLNQQLLDQAHTDCLTGLWGRGYFFELANRELSRLNRYESGLTIAILDLDHFKQINDRHGHAAGDEVLKTFADTCRCTLREIDIIGRIGGEEFAIVFPHTDAQGAAEVAERLRLAVLENPARTGVKQEIPFSVSIGIAERLPEEDKLDKILIRADEALYQAKHQGRNQVCLATDQGTGGKEASLLATTRLQ
jgi:diguanylate cyclase (GGDEF)-like protein/PAS domain S-box-containing protein